MPSQQQLRWSQLRVGITILFAALTLAVLIFLMTGTSGLFTRKMTLRAYFDSASGARNGAPVRLNGVDVGNVTGIRIVPGRRLDPVEVTMKVSAAYPETLRKSSRASLATAGVLGEVFVDIMGFEPGQKPPADDRPAQEGDVLASRETTEIQDVVKSTQTTLQNMDILLRRLDRVVATVESGEGSVGKFINDPELFNRINRLIAQLQNTVDQVTKGSGTIGKLIYDDGLYQRVNSSVTRLDRIVAGLEEGKGTAGKFLKDPALYDNANQTISKANKLMDDINQGKGTLGKLASDPQFAAKIDKLVSDMNLIVARLEQGEGTAGAFLKDPALYNNSNQMLLEARNLVKAIRENPKKFLTIKLELF